MWPARMLVSSIRSAGERVAAVLHDVDALLHLQPISSETPDGLGVVGEEGDGASAGAAVPVFDHEAGEDTRVLVRLHEGAGAGFDVENESIEALGELLGHDAGSDEVGGFDRGGVVAGERRGCGRRGRGRGVWPISAAPHCRRTCSKRRSES